MATALETRIQEEMIMSNSNFTLSSLNFEWNIGLKDGYKSTISGCNIFPIYDKDWVIFYDNNGELGRYTKQEVIYITRTIRSSVVPLPVKPEAPCDENEAFVPGVLTRFLEKFRLKGLYTWLIGNNYE